MPAQICRTRSARLPLPRAPRLACCAAVALALLWSRGARAQLHTDLSAQVGLEKRLLAARAAGVPDASPGLRADLRGHVALFPFIRIGAYGAFAFANQGNLGRSVAALGLHARIVSPVPRTESFSLWLSVGTGYARTFLSGQGAPGGGYVELPIGIGAGYKLRKPLSLFADAQSSFGVGHHGGAYAEGAGADRVALAFSLGALLDF